MSILAALAAAVTAAAPADAPQIRFCPAGGVWTYPLDDQRRVRSLLLQSFAVTNPAGPDLQVTSIEIALMNGADARDVRLIQGAALNAVGAAAPGVEMFRGMLPGQFCSGAQLGDLKAATTPKVSGGQALVVMQQSFAWAGARDAVRVVVMGERAGQPAEYSAQIPIRPGASKTQFHFPLKGAWYVGAGPTMHSHHRWGLFEEFAFDLLQIDGKSGTYRGKGTRFADYYAYGAPILAAADGTVVAVLDGVAEDVTAMKRPDETGEAYLGRLRQDQAARLAKGPPGVIGNHVVIDHGNGEFSQYAHMKPGSVRVAVGQKVKTGDVLGALGSSGNSTEPHLHFQVCDGAEPMACSAIPATFVDTAQPTDLGPHTLQTGDVLMIK